MVLQLYIFGMRITWKINIFILMLAFACFCLAGCQWLFPEEMAIPKKPEDKELLRVGIAVRPPFIEKNDQGEFTGLEIELLKLLAEKENFKLELVEYPMQELIFAVRRGEADIIAAGFTEQELENSFLSPCARHLKTGQRIIANEELAPFITEKSQLNNDKVTIYTVAGTTAAAKVKEIFPDAENVSLKNIGSCIKKILRGKGNVVMLDARDAPPAIAEPMGLEMVLGVLTDEHIAWGVRRKEKARKKQFDTFMDSLRNSGQLQQIIGSTNANDINL